MEGKRCILIEQANYPGFLKIDFHFHRPSAGQISPHHVKYQAVKKSD
jgi:hypothetical protein